MKEPVLVVLAAGMGSRFGGLKQMTPVDDKGHKIIDFSVYDAMVAGFKKVIFIIKEENHDDFEKYVGAQMRKYIDVEYIYQSFDNIPEGYRVPEDRVKPLGTGHALYCCKEVIDGPFAIINADDFYGRDGFETLYKNLITSKDDELYRYIMVAYKLGNTLTDFGTVSRGCCTCDSVGNLDTIIERTKIFKVDNGAAYTENDIDNIDISVDTPVSMNMWGFTPSFLEELETSMVNFFEKDMIENPLKAECFLPFEVDRLLKEEKAKVKVLQSSEKWFGITYKEDKEKVEKAIEELKNKGEYPTVLWE